MLFFFKPKTIHLDCFTTRPDVHRFAPIVRSTKLLPQWWKDLSKSKFDFDEMRVKNTMKGCAGFIDFFKESISIPLWTELALKVEPIESGLIYWNFSDRLTEVDTHPPSEYGEYLDKTYHHLKIYSPWVFSTKRDVNWVWTANIWNTDLLHKVNVLSGVVNYKYQHATPIQTIITRTNETQEINIKHNTPFVHLFPMSEDRVVVHNHLVGAEEYHKYNSMSIPLSFSRKYLNIKTKIQKEERKCPFHR